MIKAILFDADNTLYNTSQVAKSGDMAAMKFFSRQTKKSPDGMYDEWKDIVGRVKHSRDPARRSRRYSYALIAEKYNLSGVNQAYTLFLDTVIKRLRLDATLKKALIRLKHLKLGIITEDSKEQTTRKLRKFGIQDRFSVIITSDNTKTMKPSRSYYELSLRKLKLKPGDCAVIGDSFEKDLSIPQKEGFTTVLLGKEKTGADHAVQDFKELVKLIEKLNTT